MWFRSSFPETSRRYEMVKMEISKVTIGIIIGLLCILAVFILIGQIGSSREIKNLEGELQTAIDRNRELEVNLEAAGIVIAELEQFNRETEEKYRELETTIESQEYIIEELRKSDQESRNTITGLERILENSGNIIDDLIQFFETTID